MTAPNIIIAFYSRNGSTEALAAAVSEGARALGADVRLRCARAIVSPEIMGMAPGWAANAAAMNEKYEAPTANDAIWADAIIFGTPTRFGGIASERKAYIHGLGGVWFPGKLNGKLGGGLWLDLVQARRQRVDPAVDLQRDGSPPAHRRAAWLLTSRAVQSRYALRRHLHIAGRYPQARR